MLAALTVSAESELRWQAWLAKGRVRELRTRHRARLLAAALLVVAVVVALVFVLA